MGSLQFVDGDCLFRPGFGGSVAHLSPKRAEDGGDRIALVILTYIDIPHRGRDLRMAHQPLQHPQRHAAGHHGPEAVPQAVDRLGGLRYARARVQRRDRLE